MVKINDNFRAFFIIFDHANACASMHLLVEIHNIMLDRKADLLLMVKCNDRKKVKTLVDLTTTLLVRPGVALVVGWKKMLHNSHFLEP